MTSCIIKLMRGFTLIEMLVVVAIFTIIATIALFDQGRLNSQVLLTNLAYDVALSVREAQAYGIGVRDSGVLGSSGDFEGGYGVHLDTAHPDTVIIFNDKDDSGTYDASVGGGTTETEKEYHFQNQRGNHISEICYDGSSCSASVLNIMFKRPNPEPTFNQDDGGNSVAGPVYIILRSADGELCRAVSINSSGQVAIEDNTSDACSN